MAHSCSYLLCLSSRQFDGERDTRSPNDFTNGSDSKLDDLLEGDDDDDEPEPIPARGPVGTKKSADVKAGVDVGVKAKQSASKGIIIPTPDVSTILFRDIVVVDIRAIMQVDPLAHRPMTIPNPPMPMSAGSFSMPIPGEMQNGNGPSSLGDPLQED